MITLPLKLSSDLEWKGERAPDEVYHLDFGWSEIDPYNPVHFNANLLAVEEFTRQFPDAKKVILAISSGHFTNLFRFSEVLQDEADASPLNRELFYAQIFSDYLQRVASPLGEETIPTVVFDLDEEAPLAILALQLCKRRFEHLELEFTRKTIPIQGSASIAVSLPQDTLYEPLLFETIFSSLRGHSFKAIPEELLNEHWDGVDHLIVHRPSLGEIGRRMLYGFEAAGGEVIETGLPLQEFVKKTGLDQ